MIKRQNVKISEIVRGRYEVTDEIRRDITRGFYMVKMSIEIL